MKGAVATGHQLTSQAASEIIRSGGNAVDAAIAAFAVACVAEPCMASMAAGGFALIHFDGKTEAVDFFCQTPKVKISDARLDPIPVDFGTAQEQYYSGIGSVAVPGAAKGMFEMHRRWGSMPMKDIFAQACQYAKSGIDLTPFQALDLELLNSVFGKEERGQQIFCNGDKMKREGDQIKMEHLADFLDVLAIEGSDLMYKGEIAQSIHRLSKELGGHISYGDMAEYQVAYHTPKQIQYRDVTILTPPAPSMGHALMDAFFLKWPEVSPQLHSEEHLVHLLNCAQSFRELLDEQNELFLRAGLPVTQQKKYSGTSHMNILDKKGNAVTMTFSIGEGSGIFLENTDMHLNNMLGEPSLLPDGLDSWYPGSRLASMMTPAMIMDAQGLKFMFGSGGAERIASLLSQSLIYLEDYGLALKEAIEAPRTYMSTSNFEVEPGFPQIKDLPSTRYWDEKSMYFGGVHAIQVRPEISSYGDPRREGNASIIE